VKHTSSETWTSRGKASLSAQPSTINDAEIRLDKITGDLKLAVSLHPPTIVPSATDGLVASILSFWSTVTAGYMCFA
jgi:hypothetical protein